MDEQQGEAAILAPLVDEIDVALEVYEELSAHLQTAEQRFKLALVSFAERSESSAEARRAMLHRLYWDTREISATWIAEAFGIVPQRVAREAGHLAMEMHCTTCQKPYILNVKSRSHLAEVRSQTADKLTYLCIECEAAARQATQQKQQQERAMFTLNMAEELERRKARIAELRAMPYADYLQTPEWSARRQRAFKRAWFRCQLCNSSKGGLNVHHRTYERLGDERDSDLIVLCEKCHEIFHREGKLAR